jgi:hypothetical protein
MRGKWREMVDLVNDEMLDGFGTVGTVDEVGAKLKQRCGALAHVVHLDLPPEIREDEKFAGTLVEELHG